MIDGPNGCTCGHNGDCNCPFVPSPDALVIEDDAPEAEEARPPKKRRKGTSPTARTLAECRKRGWIAQVVEKFVRFPPPGHLVDLFGVLDIVAIVPARYDAVLIYGQQPRVIEPGYILGIQATANSGGLHARRRAKILAEPRMRQWLEAGARLELWTWALQGARGKAKRWTLRVEVFTVDQWRSPDGGTSSGAVVSQGGGPSPTLAPRRAASPSA